MTIDNSRALHYEEKLLWDLSQSDGSAVDGLTPTNKPLKTGLQARGDIGLPKLKEPQVVRHFVRLSTLNYSIDSGFFPLGSCTMKHNPRLNEKMARLNGFANIHPLQDEKNIQGALGLMYELQNWLGSLTGLPAVCLSPAAGAHGELAGIMTIRRAHELKGNAHKRVILVPDSAHGTNPATAAMCGFDIRVIPTKDTGMVTKDAFLQAFSDGHDVAGMMVTNPHKGGFFLRGIKENAGIFHRVGGYFFCGGADFYALVGNVCPADFGVDVMHINLHKTFSTPHGGGGPGSGPICVVKELEPYLPIPRVIKTNDHYHLETHEDRTTSFGRLKGFHGQFGMFVRALTYMLSHGADGLKMVSRDAVLSANYILASLKNDFHAPFTDVPSMHECLLTDKWQKESGVTTLDIAKTLVEYGIHPMTVFFPLTLQGTMLIEPTETESKDELDRFIAVMKMIAQTVKDGQGDVLHTYPVSSPRRRLDEVTAARKPRLKYGAE